MNKEEIMELLDYIEGQLECGYIDLGCCYEEAELKIVRQAIEEYKVNHGLTV